MAAKPPTLLDYLRHGEPVGGSRFRGNGVDDPLSENGWSQMRTNTEALGGWQRVVSSPMRRCADFAAWIAEQRGLPMEIHEDLREVGFGAWEGLGRDEVKFGRSAEYTAFYRDPVNNRPAGAEPLAAFGARSAAAFDGLLDTYPGQHLLVVAHAGVIRATLGHVLQAPPETWYRVEVEYAAVTRFARTDRGVRLVTHNWRPGI